MALDGHTFDDIAQEVGYANRGTAWRTVQKAFDGRVIQSVDDYRDAELARLDVLEDAHWEAAVSGDNLKAAELCLKISGHRSKILGLDMPAKGSVEPAPTTTLIIGGTKEEYIAGLKQLTRQGR